MVDVQSRGSWARGGKQAASAGSDQIGLLRMTEWTPDLFDRIWNLRYNPRVALFSRDYADFSMKTEFHLPKEREGVASALNAAIGAVNFAKELSSVTPAKAVFGSVSVILTMIRVSPLLVLFRSARN